MYGVLHYKTQRGQRTSSTQTSHWNELPSHLFYITISGTKSLSNHPRNPPSSTGVALSCSLSSDTTCTEQGEGDDEGKKYRMIIHELSEMHTYGELSLAILNPVRGQAWMLSFTLLSLAAGKARLYAEIDV